MLLPILVVAGIATGFFLGRTIEARTPRFLSVDGINQLEQQIKDDFGAKGVKDIAGYDVFKDGVKILRKA